MKIVNNLKDYRLVLLLLLFAAHLFTRFYLLEERLSFNWDQVDNAWAAKSILVDGEVLLSGMVAKGNAGFHIGPAYYYYMAIFYWLANLDPIASGIAAGVTSVITFWIIWLVTKRIFSSQIALIALFVHTFSIFIIESDRSQWPVNFIVPVSYLLFYSLYEVLKGNARYLVLLAMVLGFSIHIHFTSVFYPIIIILIISFIPWNKITIKYSLYSLFIFVIWLIPTIIVELCSHGEQAQSLNNYLNTNYHGFHLRRVLQIAGDAFIEFPLIFRYRMMEWLKYLLIPLFIAVYLYRELSRKTIVLCVLISLWIVVPWFVFATYSGEITNYYFFMTRPIILLIAAYLLYKLFLANLISRVIVVSFLLFFAYVNIQQFLTIQPSTYKVRRSNTLERIAKGEIIEWQLGVPESYFYYIEKRGLENDEN